MRASELEQMRMKEAKARLVSLMGFGMLLEDVECLLNIKGKNHLADLSTNQDLNSREANNRLTRLKALGMINRDTDVTHLYHRISRHGVEITRDLRDISKLTLQEIWKDLVREKNQLRQGHKVREIIIHSQEVRKPLRWNALGSLILGRLGLDEYCLDEFMKTSDGPTGQFLTGHYPCEIWPTKHTAMFERMIQLDLIDARDGAYWYTELGKNFRMLLDLTKQDQPSKAPTVQPQNPLTLQESQDVDWNRDGLMLTCSKLWWLWVNGHAVREAQMSQQMKEFMEGHQLVEQACQDIATSEQRVARQFMEAKPVAPQRTWSEEEQRRLNDIYWMSDRSAFWLNPHGALAEPTQAPEWWEAPQDLRSITAERIALLIDDTVDRSLLPPPQKNDSFDPLAGIPARGPKGEVGQAVNLSEVQGAEDQSRTNLGCEPNWLAGLQGWEKNGHVVALETQREVDNWIGMVKKKNMGYSVARRDSLPRGENNLTYGEMLSLYQGRPVEAPKPTDYQNELAAQYSHFVEVLNAWGYRTYYACINAQDAINHGATGVSHRVSMRGDRLYGRFLRAYETQINTAKESAAELRRLRALAGVGRAQELADINNQARQINQLKQKKFF